MDNEKRALYTSKLELLKFTTEVADTHLNKSLTSDFILAKLPQKEKDLITEMVHNAVFTKRIIETCKKSKKWVWTKDKENPKKGKWHRQELSKLEIELIEKYASNTFDTFMTRLKTIAILNRNQKENHLLDSVTGFIPESELPMTGTGEEETKMEVIENYLRDKMGGKGGN